MKLSLNTTLPAAALAVIGYAVLATSANASATSQLNKCRFDTKKQVVDCCERVLRDENKPMWMIESGSSCGSAAKCVGKASSARSVAIAYVPSKKRKCFIQIQFNETDNGRNVDKPQRPQRGSFNRSFN